MKGLFTRRINADRLLAILAFIVSVSTLYVFFYQTSLMKKQQYASVLPYLSVGNSGANKDYGFVLTNNGIGPAFIDEINIHYKDSVYRNIDINNFFEKVIRKEDTIFNSVNVTHSTIRKGMLVPHNQAIYMIKLSKKAKDFKIKHYKLRDWLNNKVKIEIKYSSVYKEKWHLIYPGKDAPIQIK